MDLRGYIDVTGVDLQEMIRKAYELSKPFGLGYIHYKEGPLTELELEMIWSKCQTKSGIYIDYLVGRSMKFRILRHGERDYFYLDWYDHNRDLTGLLLRRLNLPDVENKLAKAAEEIDKRNMEQVW